MISMAAPINRLLEDQLLKSYVGCSSLLLDYITAIHNALYGVLKGLEKQDRLSAEKISHCDAYAAKLKDLHDQLKLILKSEANTCDMQDIAELLNICTTTHEIAAKVEDEYNAIDAATGHQFALQNSNFITRLIYALSALIGLIGQVSSGLTDALMENPAKSLKKKVYTTSDNAKTVSSTVGLSETLNKKCISEFKAIGNNTLEFAGQLIKSQETAAVKRNFESINGSLTVLNNHVVKLANRLDHDQKDITQHDVNTLTNTIEAALNTTDTIRSVYEKLTGKPAMELGSLQANFAIDTVERTYSLTMKLQKLFGLQRIQPMDPALLEKLHNMHTIIDQNLNKIEELKK